MTIIRIQLAVDELGVIFLNVTATRFTQQVVACIHFHAQRVQCLHYLCNIGNDGVFGIRKFSQVMVFDRCVNGKLNLLRVDNDKFQFAWVLLI